MEIDLVLKIAAVGLIVAVINQVLARSGRDEYGLLTTLAGLIVVLLMLLPKIKELYSAVGSVMEF